MAGPVIPTSTRRTVASVQRIQSPLTRVGYTLQRETSHLVLVVSGRVSIRRNPDNQAYEADSPRLIWRTECKSEELIAEGGARATLLSIPRLALSGALPATPLGDQMRRTLGQGLSFPLAQDSSIPGLIEGLAFERSQAEPGSEVATAHYLSLVLVQLWRLAREDLVAHGRAPQGLAERFVTLAGQRVREHLKVAEYAHALGVSRDRLGSAVRGATGRSPQAYLHELIIREASELLANTGMPVSRVAYRLGFPDPAYFSRFFTRHRGESPAKFRRTAKEKRAAGDLSYSAWP